MAHGAACPPPCPCHDLEPDSTPKILLCEAVSLASLTAAPCSRSRPSGSPASPIPNMNLVLNSLAQMMQPQSPPLRYEINMANRATLVTNQIVRSGWPWNGRPPMPMPTTTQNRPPDGLFVRSMACPNFIASPVARNGHNDQSDIDGADQTIETTEDLGNVLRC